MGTRSPTLNRVACDIILLCRSLRIRLEPSYIRGELNVLADTLSRRDQIIPTEWSLHPQIVQNLWQTWWKPDLDLFATRNNRKLRRFFSPFPDPEAEKTDAMAQNWDGLRVYAFPPFNLVGKVLLKLSRSLDTQMILIAPRWEHQPWFPLTRQLQVSVPISLPLWPGLLTQTESGIPMTNPSFLRLQAFNLRSP